MAKQYGLIDGEAARRHHALAGRKLAVSVQPMPGEGAADLILRASALNAYHYPFEIMKIIGGKREQRFSHYGVAKWGLTLDGLGDLLGTRKGQSDIAPLLYPSTGRDSFDFFSSNLPYHQLIGHRRVAPTFLKYGGYQKAIWHIKSLTFDPSTFETLLDKCPVCRARLTFVSTKGICSCHKCFDPNDRRKASVDLRDYPQPIVEFDDEEAVRFVTDLIDPERVDRGRAALHPELREFNPGHLFEFIVQAAKALDFKTGVCRALQSNFSAVGEVSAKNLSVAGRAMINWPHGFIEMAESLKNAWFFPQTKDFYAHPLRVRLMSPFYDPRFRKLMTSGIKSSLRASVLIAVDGTTKTTPSTSPPVSWHDLSRYAHASKLVREESAKSGLPVSALLACYASGFWCPDQLLARNWHATTRSVCELTSIEVPRTRGKKRTLSMSDIVLALYHLPGSPWPQMLQGILEQTLPTLRKSVNSPYIRGLVIGDFEVWKAFFADLAPGPDGSSAEITGGEAGFYLGMSGPQISNLVAYGFLSSGRISMAEIWDFRRKFISPKEVAARLQVNGEIALANLVGGELNKAGIPAIRLGSFVRSRIHVEQYYGSRLA